MKTQRSPFYLAMALAVTAVCLSALGATSNGPENKTPQDVFDGMRKSFCVEKAKGIHVRYQWELSGPNGGHWFIEVDDGKCRVEKGKIDNPNVTFIASDKDWVALSNGKLSGKWAFFTGRLKIRGPQSLARELDEMFP